MWGRPAGGPSNTSTFLASCPAVWDVGAGPQVFVERFDPGVAIKRIASLSERDRERLIRDAYADLRGRQPS